MFLEHFGIYETFQTLSKLNFNNMNTMDCDLAKTWTFKLTKKSKANEQPIKIIKRQETNFKY
jgi:hypothetical protein